MIRTLAAVVAILFCPAAFAQGEAITIKIKKLAVGDKTKETKIASESMNINGIVMGEVLKDEQKKVAESVFTDEVIEIAEGLRKPTKFQRTYEKTEVTTKGNTAKIPVEGKTILIVRGEKSNTYTIDDKPVSPEVEQFLNAELSGKKEDDSFEMLLPKEAIKPGDTWKIDIEKVAKSFDGNIAVDAEKSKGTGKLVKTYKKGNATFGQFDVTIDLAVTRFGSGAQAIPAKAGNTVVIQFSMDGCLDGSEETGKSTMTMKGKIEADIPNVTIVVDLDMKMEGTREQLKK